MDALQITTVVAAVVTALANLSLAFSDWRRVGREVDALQIVRSQLDTMKDMFDTQAGQSRSLIRQLGRLVEVVANLGAKAE